VPLLDVISILPLHPRRHWESFHVIGEGAIADALRTNRSPGGYFAEEHAHAGAANRVDVATFGMNRRPRAKTGRSRLNTYAPPAPALVIPTAFPDEFEVRGV